MVKLYLLEFIKQQRSNKYSDDQIREFLIRNGYSAVDVDEAFKYVASNISPPQNVAQQTVTASMGQQGYASQLSQQAKKEFSHIGIYLIFLILVVAIGGGFLYMNGIFGTPSVTMDQLINMVTGTPKAETPELIGNPVQHPSQPAAPAVAQPQQPANLSQTPQQNNTNNTQANQQAQANQTQANISAAQQPQKPTAPVVSADKTTYSSSAKGVSFSYPKTWNLTESADGKSITLTMPENNNINMKNEVKIRLSALSTSTANLNDYTTWIYTQFGFKGEKATSTTFGGSDAYYLQKTMTSGTGNQTLVKKIYLLTSVNPAKTKGFYIYYIALNTDYDASFSSVQDMISTWAYK